LPYAGSRVLYQQHRHHQSCYQRLNGHGPRNNSRRALTHRRHHGSIIAKMDPSPYRSRFRGGGKNYIHFCRPLPQRPVSPRGSNGWWLIGDIDSTRCFCRAGPPYTGQSARVCGIRPASKRCGTSERSEGKPSISGARDTYSSRLTRRESLEVSVAPTKSPQGSGGAVSKDGSQPSTISVVPSLLLIWVPHS